MDLDVPVKVRSQQGRQLELERAMLLGFLGGEAADVAPGSGARCACLEVVRLVSPARRPGDHGASAPQERESAIPSRTG